jgi:hypothetical protein
MNSRIKFMMPVGIILLILFYPAQNIIEFLGWKGLTLSNPPKIVEYEEQN